jgi:hypothetical protein
MDVTRRIVSERANGRTFRTIADGSMADGISTPGAKPSGFQRRSGLVSLFLWSFETGSLCPAQVPGDTAILV